MEVRLVDGVLAIDGAERGTWAVERTPGAAALVVRPHRRLRKDEREAVVDAAARTLDELVPDAVRLDVEVTAPG